MTGKDRNAQTQPTRLLIAEMAVPPPQHPTLTDLLVCRQRSTHIAIMAWPCFRALALVVSNSARCRLPSCQRGPGKRGRSQARRASSPQYRQGVGIWV